MSARADLTGQIVDGWNVVAKAPAQNRVPFWTCAHEPCGIVVDLAHVTLKKAIDGKGNLAPCTTCVPADERPRISHGMHLACGAAHLLGTVCPDGVQREPGSTTPPSAVSPGAAATCAGPSPAPAPRTSWSLDPLGEFGIDHGAAVESRPVYTGHPIDAQPDSAYQQAIRASEPEPAAQLADASTGALVVHGRVDRLEAPQEILDVIREGMHGRQRNHQSEPGPSQIGGCERRVGYHLAYGEGNGARGDESWRPEVGTAVHAWLDGMFHGAAGYISDFAVTAPVAGKLDLYDIAAKRIVDFKITGKTTRDKAAKGNVSEKYEVQLDLYGLGMIVAGHPVESVALLFLPAAGSLSESVWYERPFNLARALEAVAKRDRIKAMLSMAEPERVLAALSIAEDYCGGCPAFGNVCEGAAMTTAAAAPALRMVGGAA